MVPDERLLDRLATLEDQVAWLQDVVKPPAEQFVRFRHLSLSPSQKTILYALWEAKNTLPHENLRRRLDLTLGVHDERGLKSVDVTIYWLRKKLEKLKPPIEISNERGVGFYLDDENKARLAEIMRKKR